MTLPLKKYDLMEEAKKEDSSTWCIVYRLRTVKLKLVGPKAFCDMLSVKDKKIVTLSKNSIRRYV